MESKTLLKKNVFKMRETILHNVIEIGEARM